MTEQDRTETLDTYKWDDAPTRRVCEALGLIEKGVRLEIIKGSAFEQALRDLLAQREEMIEVVSTAI